MKTTIKPVPEALDFALFLTHYLNEVIELKFVSGKKIIFIVKYIDI